MMSSPWIEWLGYLASAMVATSLMMSSVRWLRWLNLAGSLLFVSYGLAVQAWPVVAANGFITLVNLWHLARMYSESSATSGQLAPQPRDEVRPGLARESREGSSQALHPQALQA